MQQIPRKPGMARHVLKDAPQYVVVKADEQPTERVADTLAWARSRIEWCRREEAKFGAGSIAIEAATERRALVAVVRMLTGRDDA